MSPVLEIFEQFAPLILFLLATIPLLFVYALNKSKDKPKPANSHPLIAYLICVGVIAFVLVVMKAIELMPVDNSDRALFICSMLVIACIDQGLSLLPLQAKLQFDLTGLLLYSVILLSAIPLLWQISRNVVPVAISSQANIMDVVQILLMLIMIILCFVNGVLKKRKHA